MSSRASKTIGRPFFHLQHIERQRSYSSVVKRKLEDPKTVGSTDGGGTTAFCFFSELICSDCLTARPAPRPPLFFLQILFCDEIVPRVRAGSVPGKEYTPGPPVPVEKSCRDLVPVPAWSRVIVDPEFVVEL